EQIKDYLSAEALTGAQELFEEIPYDIQKLLMTAPTKGGVFTTQERETMKSLWKVTEEDMNNSNEITIKALMSESDE
ncbi:MAG: hypothetical protein KJO69_01630, partial [Gammaproteobacteria bacterium]|nr:hypothetical protein [Gammaproteobacteria bacterium]